MSISRRVARPLLASIFIGGGLDAVQHPESKVKAAEAVTVPLTKAVPALPSDTETLVRINGAVQVGAGVLLAVGKFRRLSAVVLIGSILPTTYAGHRFWEEEDAETRRMQQMHFLKNVGLLGGLVLAAVDTEGAPSLGWRAKRKARVARKALGASRGRAARKARTAATAASFAASAGSSHGSSLASGSSRVAKKAADLASNIDLGAAQGQLVKAAKQVDWKKAQKQAAKAAKQVDWKKAQQQVAKAAHQIDLQHAQQQVAKAAHQIDLQHAPHQAAKVAKHGVDVADAYLHAGADRTGDLLSALSHHSGDLVSKAADHLPSR